MKKIINYVIGIALLFIPHFLGVTPTVQLLSIFVGSIFLWITCPIEIGGILCLCALCMLPGVTTASVFTNSFGNSTIMFLIFSMALTYALSSTGVLRRVALFFVNNNLAKKSPYWFMGLYFLSMLVIGSFLAPTTLFILYYGLAQEIFSLLNLEKGDPLAKRMMVGTGFFASISCAWTPIAHTFPLMALGYYETATGEAISYGTYMKYSLPIGALLSVFAFVILSIGIKKIQENYNFEVVHFEQDKWTRNEIISVVVFGLVVMTWIATGVAPKTLSAINALGTAFPAMVGVAVLAILGVSSVKDGFVKGVSWQSIILCASTLALGVYLKSDDFGIISALTEYMTPMLSKVNVTLLIVAFAVILTNLISNIVTTTVSFNLFVPMLLATTVMSPVTATIAIGICASLAYALPSSIAHIALAGSSGWATNKDMLKYGAIMVAFSILAVTLVML